MEKHTECRFDPCDKDARNKGLCWGHAEQLRQGYELSPLRARRPTGTHLIRDVNGCKLCADCGEWKPETDFSARQGKADGLNAWCRVCAGHRSRLWKFGLSADRYAALLAEQGGRCAVCRNEPSEWRGLSVDHDHACCPGKRSCGECIRGLLCTPCNVSLGAFGDDPARLLAAADYLMGSKHERRLGRVYQEI